MAPAADGEVRVYVPAGAMTDLAGAPNEASNILVFQYDGTAPTVVITTGVDAPVSGTFPISVTFSEDVTGLAIEDLVITNGSASNFAGSGAAYTAEITPEDDGAVTVDIAAGAAEDAASNASAAAEQFSIMSNSTNPGVAITTDASDPVSGAFSITVTFTEAVTGFELTDLSLSNATASNLSGSGAVFTVDIEPVADGTVTVDLPASAVEDAAGNANLAAPQFAIVSDSTPPSVSIGTAAGAPVTGTFEISVDFSEAVTGFELSDLAVENGEASDLSGSGAGYTAQITPAGDGAVTVDIAAGAAFDTAGNASLAADGFSIAADVTVPGVFISSPASDPVSGAFEITVTFTEPVTGFEIGDIAVGNGAVDAFSGSGAVYVAEINPAGDGSVTVDIASGVAEDAAGNGNTAAARFSIVNDETSPSVTLSTAASDPTNGPFTVTAAFTKPVTGLTAGDFVVTNATASDLIGSEDSYSVTITPSGDGAVEVSLPDGAAEDAAGNTSTASNTVRREIDTQRPAVTLASASNDPTNGPFIVSAIFTKPVTGLVAGDFAVVNGAASNLSGDGDSYTFTITPSDDGEVEVTLPEGAAEDAAGNTSTASNALARQIDTVRPEVTLTSASNDPTNGAFSVTATFTKPVTGLTVLDFALTNGTAADLSGSGDSYTLTITPAEDGTVTVSLPESAAEDGAGNTNTTSNTLSRQIITQRPEVTLTSEASDPTNGAFTVTAVFTKPVTGLTAGDLVVTNATASDLIGSEDSYSVTITPSGDGSVQVSLPEGAAEDAAGNTSTASNTVSREIDTQRPAVTLASASNDPINRPFEISITFTEPVTGFEEGDITVGNGTVTTFSGSGALYAAEITPSSDGAVTVDIAEDAGLDAAGNGNTAAQEFSIEADITEPELTISLPGDTTTGAFVAEFSFSEPVDGFDLSDIVIINGAASAFTGSGASYSATVTPEAPGVITVEVGEGAGADAVGNSSIPATASLEAIAEADDIILVLDSSSNDPGAVAGTATISNPGSNPLSFNAAADVFWLDVSPASGTIGSLGSLDIQVSLNERVFELPAGEYVGTVSVTIGGGDSSSAMTTAATSGSLLVDIPISLEVQPRFGDVTLVVTTPSGPSGEASFAFASEIEGFDGLTLTTNTGRASVSAEDILQGSYSITQSLPAGWRTQSISCTGDLDGGSSFDVGAGTAVIDLDPNETLVCTFANVRNEDAVRLATQRAIRGFMVRRADRIVEAAPDLSRRFSERSTTERGAFAADVDGSGRYQMSLAGSLSGLRNAAAANTPAIANVANYERPFMDGWDVWFAAELSGVSDNRAGERAESDFGVAQVGVDYQLSDTMIVGLLGQYDWMQETAGEVFENAGAVSGARVEGEGWMAGPYAVWRIRDSLTFDALAMYGRSSNAVNPLGLYEDDFKTDRLMLRANLTGEVQFGSGSWRLRPQAGVTHFEETQDGYVDSLGIVIPEQTVSLGRFHAGPELAWRHTGDRGGWLELTTALNGVWDYQAAELLSEAGFLVGGEDDLRADARFGLSTLTPWGALIRFETGFDGIGIGEFEAKSGRLEIRIPFGATGSGRSGAPSQFGSAHLGYSRCDDDFAPTGFTYAAGAAQECDHGRMGQRTGFAN